MGNFRELIGRDLNSTLESDHHEMPVDRLGAFSKGSRLGTLLWRLKYGKDLRCFHVTALVLAKETKLNFPIGIRLCELAISEWLMTECETCRGAREVMFGPKRILCPTCDGCGVKRYSPWERDTFMRRGKNEEERLMWRRVRFQPWTKKYGSVVAVLTSHAGGINPTMNTELER